MNLLHALKRAFIGDVGEPAVLDHAPVPTGNPDWRTEKLKGAADRFGKPFKCAADGLPRETMVDRKFVDVAKARGENVRALPKRQKS